MHAGLLAARVRGESLPYLVRGAGGKLVGRVNFTRLRPGPASLGYRFAQAAGGQGYATAAVAEALALARQAGVRQVQATVAHDNPASRRVLEKLGFSPLPETPPGLVERNGQKILVQTWRLNLA